METLKDFVSELKNRISNPFISSFVISWLVLNYPIIVGLLFYKQDELIKDGYRSYIDLISTSYKISNMLWLPLAIALFYTFIFSFFKSLITVFQSWLVSYTNTKIYVWTNKHTVTVEYHAEQVLQLQEEKKTYVDLAAKGKQMRYENEDLKEKNLKLEDEVKLARERNTELTKNHDLTVNRLNEEHDKRIIELQTQENERVGIIQKDALERYQVLLKEKSDLQDEYNQLSLEDGVMRANFQQTQASFANAEILIHNQGRSIEDCNQNLQNAKAELSSALAEIENNKQSFSDLIRMLDEKDRIIHEITTRRPE